MGLEALPAQWHLLSGSSPRPLSRPSLLVDALIDGQRNPLTRRSQDASECSSRGSSSRRHQASQRASVDGGAPQPGFPSRGPWNSEKGPRRGPSSSSLRRTESLWSGQGFPEQSSPSGLFRWKSEVGGLMRRAARFDDFPGDRWRRPEHDFYEAPEHSYQGFDRLGVDTANPINPSSQESGRGGWSRSESARYESQGRTGERESEGTTAEGAEVLSAVDVTAPSFVKDRQFMDRTEHHPRGGGGTSSRIDLGFVDQNLDGLNCISRPASLKRKTAKVCASGDDDSFRVSSRDSRAGQVPLGLGPQAKCVSIPDSLRNLRKRNSGQAARGEGVCSIKKAFNSMVFMIRALQSYTFELRQNIVSDANVQHLVSMVHREMHSSFVWLFQQVFSCTPTLMVSVMILLANFTVYSLGNNVSMGAVIAHEPTELVSTLQTQVERGGVAKPSDRWNGLSFVRVDSPVDSPPISNDTAGRGFGNHGPGGVGGGSVIVAVGEDGHSYNSRGGSGRNAMFSDKDFDSVDFGSGGRGTLKLPINGGRALFSPVSPGISEDKSSAEAWTGPGQSATQKELRSSEQLRSYRVLLEQTVRELELKPGGPYHHVQLDQETLRILVAPVATKMESDDYPCFDRTDLEYQHAIRAKPSNPMLLANYAQFLYVVRHDNVRAEAFFHRALRVDRQDGDILGRWASFLWLALKDRRRADKAYREALSVDPTNPYHAGSYAHFLWHAEDDEDSSGQLQGAF
ncbi:unnamed protein product [Calypogeia fissa]